MNIKKTLINLVVIVALAIPFAAVLPVEAATPNWDVTGTWVATHTFEGNTYTHQNIIVQAPDGTLTGTGGWDGTQNGIPFSTPNTWAITSGSSVSGSAIHFNYHYTSVETCATDGTVDAVINSDGSMTGTWSDNCGSGRTGTWTTVAGTAKVINVTTNPATSITSADATLNGLNGPNDATGHSFWVSTSPFVTTSPTIPSGVYSTPDFGAIAANTTFSASLSSITTSGVPNNLPAITPNTTYYFVAWSLVNGTWYPGAELSFKTAEASQPTIPVYNGGGSCGAGKIPVLLSNLTQTVNSTNQTPVTVILPNTGEYLFEATGDYGYGGSPNNNVTNRADAGYATGDTWGTTLDSILGISPTATYRGVTSLLSDMGMGTGQMGIVNWGSYSSSHDYKFDYNVTNPNVQFVISDWWSTWYNGGSNNNQGGVWDNAGNLTLNVYQCQAVLPSVTTQTATNMTLTDATLNGFNGPVATTASSFWVSTSPFVTTSPTIPSGVYSTPVLGPVAANTAFSASLSSITTSGVPGNLPAITPNTTYYFAAWIEVGGTWYPGAVLSFTTPALAAACPAGTTPTLLEADTVNSASSTDTVSTNPLLSGQTYLLVSSGTWQNSNLNVADTAYASTDNWTNYMEGYNIAPVFLGSGEFQLQVNDNFVNWGSYNTAHQYSYLYTGTGNPVKLMAFDGDSTTNPPTQNSGWYGDNSGNLAVNIYSCTPTTGTLVVEKYAVGGDGTFSLAGNGIGSFTITTTNGTGSKEFNLAPGNYTVTEPSVLGNWQQTDNDCTNVSVVAGGTATCTVTNVKIGTKNLGEIRGTKYEDRDGDGILKDGDNHRLGGVTIYLDLNNNGQLDSGEPSTVTNKYGDYRFASLPAGTYTVREVVQPGWKQTYPASGSYKVTLATGKMISKKNDFGNFLPGTISGTVFNDQNGNHRKDSGELGLAGWTVTLMLNSVIKATTTTDGSGNYSFTGVVPGIYQVKETVQSGWINTTINPLRVMVNSGTVSKNDNFGNHNGPVNYKGGHDWWDNDNHSPFGNGK